jgi:hypothetical protein
VNLHMDSKNAKEVVCRGTLRSYWFEFRGCNRASLEMHVEAVMVATWGVLSSKIADTRGCHDREGLQVHIEAIRELVWKCT